MAKIKLSMENFSSEADYLAAIQQISAAMPAGTSAEPATQTRDANGKLVSVTIGMPGNPNAAERTAARNAVINANPGVAQALALSIEMSEDFNSFTPGDPVPSVLVIDDQTVGFTELNLKGNYVFASAAESVGGTGSAIELKPVDTNGLSTRVIAAGKIAYNVNDNDLSQITAFTMSFDIIASSAGDVGNAQHFKRFSVNGIGQTGFVRGTANSGGNCEIQAFLNTSIDTGVDEYTNLHVDVTLTSDGVWTITAGSATDTIDFGFTKSYTEINIQMNTNDQWSPLPTSGQFTPEALIVDNYIFNITDAS